MSSYTRMSGTQKATAKGKCPTCQIAGIGREITTMEDVLACLEPFRNMKQEHLVSLSLDSGRRLITRRIVTIGLLNASLVHPRELFAGPLTDRAASVIVAHNHPSGKASPSKEDVRTTQQLVEAGQLLGVPLEDHIIVTIDESFSFRQHSLIS